MLSSVDDVLCVSDPDNPINCVWNMATFNWSQYNKAVYNSYNIYREYELHGSVH